MWSGFSSEIETTLKLQRKPNKCCVACGAASRLRLKQQMQRRLGRPPLAVACGAASRLRLKLRETLQWHLSKKRRKQAHPEAQTRKRLWQVSLQSRCGLLQHRNR